MAICKDLGELGPILSSLNGLIIYHPTKTIINCEGNVKSQGKRNAFSPYYQKNMP